MELNVPCLGVLHAQITNTLQQVLSLLQSQQQELKQMKQDIAKSQQANSIIQSMRSRIDKLDKSLCTKMEATMAKQSEQERILLNGNEAPEC